MTANTLQEIQAVKLPDGSIIGGFHILSNGARIGKVTGDLRKTSIATLQTEALAKASEIKYAGRSHLDANIH